MSAGNGQIKCGGNTEGDAKDRSVVQLKAHCSASSRLPPRVIGSCSEAKSYQFPVPVAAGLLCLATVQVTVTAVRLSGAVKSVINGMVVSDIFYIKCASDVFDVSAVNVIEESVVVRPTWRKWSNSVHCLYAHSAWIIYTSIDLFLHQKATPMDEKACSLLWLHQQDSVGMGCLDTWIYPGCVSTPIGSPVLTVTVPHTSTSTKQVCEVLEMYKEQPLGLCLKGRHVGVQTLFYESTRRLCFMSPPPDFVL